MDKQMSQLYIKDWPKIERPREKLIRYGPGKLTNTELLAILLRSGRKGENVIALARRLLKHYTTEKLPHLTYAELKNCCGLGPAGVGRYKVSFTGINLLFLCPRSAAIVDNYPKHRIVVQ